MARLYVFGNYTVDPHRRELHCAGTRVQLNQQAFGVLAYLVANYPNVVSQEELWRAVRGEDHLQKGTLHFYISNIRNAIGDKGRREIIKNSPGHGWRFAAPVEILLDDCHETVEIEITVERDFDSYSEEEQEQLLLAIRHLLNMNGDIRIKKKHRGSIKLTLELPRGKAHDLLLAIRSGALKTYDVVDAALKQPQETTVSKFTTTSEVTIAIQDRRQEIVTPMTALMPPIVPGALPPICNVPSLRNPHFTGRDYLLTALRAALIEGHPAALTQALSGLGGVGKTQLAIEYVYRYASEYAVVWWVRAEEPEALVADYATLAKELELPEQATREQDVVATAVRRWLEQHSGWLLIFDNAQEPEALRASRPRSATGHVLITSRNPNWRGVANALTVPVLERVEAIDFLLRRTGKEDTESAAVLAEALGDLPLALEQAGAYIETTGITLTAYLERFRNRQAELLRHRTPSSDYPATVATTWEMAFQSVQQISPAAADLLRLCAFLAPDDIPRDLLSQGRQHLPEIIATAVRDPLAFDEAIATLRRYSLIGSTRNGDAFIIHRLVQAVTRDTIREDTRQHWETAALRLTNDALRQRSGGRTWDEALRLLPHALAALGHAEHLGKVAIMDRYNILLFQAIRHDTGGRPQDAEQICRELSTELSPSDKEYATVCINLATFCDHQGRPQEGLAILDDLLSQPDAEQLYGERSWWWARYQRGIMLHRCARHKEAEESLSQVRIHAPKPSDRIGALHQLGLIALAQGDYAMAESRFTQCLAERPSNDYRRAYEYHGLGQVYVETGRLEEARRTLSEAIRITSTYGFQRYQKEIEQSLMQYGLERLF